MAWLRLYDNILDDPKIQMLSDRAFRMLINLWCLAKRQGGKLPADETSLAFSLRCPVVKVRDTLQALISANLIDRTDDGYEPHDWKEHQYDSDSAAERMRRYRERNKSKKSDEELQPPLRNSDAIDSDTDTDTEQSQKEEEVRAEKARRPRKAKHAIPDHFPDDEARRKAQEVWSKKGRPDLAASVLDEMAHFRDYHISHATTSADWSASWRTWIKTAPGFTPQQRANGNGRGRPESPYEQTQRIANKIITGDQNPDFGRDSRARVELRAAADDRRGAGGVAPDVVRRLGTQDAGGNPAGLPTLPPKLRE